MLSVKRNSKKVAVCTNVLFHINLFSQGTGLMLHKKIRDEAHIFPFDKKKKVALTMWFVFFPIDVLFLDEKKRIIEMKENFRPFTNYYPEKQASYVIELPEGTIRKKELAVGQNLYF